MILMLVKTRADLTSVRSLLWSSSGNGDSQRQRRDPDATRIPSLA